MDSRAQEPKSGLDSEKKDKSGNRGGPKESLRWIEGYERIAEMAANLPRTRLVYVPDREADLVSLMLRAQELGAPADWLVRAPHNRCLPDGEKPWQHTGAGEPVGEISFAMAARHGVKARTVRQQLWVRKVDLPAGKRTCLRPGVASKSVSWQRWSAWRSR